MSDFLNNLEGRSSDQRDQDIAMALPQQIALAQARATGFSDHLKGVSPRGILSAADLAKLPVLRKSDIGQAQSKNPPFGG